MPNSSAPRAWVKLWGRKIHTSARVLGLPTSARCAYVFLLATVGEDGRPRNPTTGEDLSLEGLVAFSTLDPEPARAALLALADARLLYHDATGWRLWNARHLQARVGTRAAREDLPDRHAVERTLALIRGPKSRDQDPTPNLYAPTR